jgi:rod shape-determining protein MreC
MIRLSIQARQALARLTLPVLIAVSFGVMLLGKADTVIAEKARTALADGLGPIYAILAAPLVHVHATIAETVALWDMRGENARLRKENEKLRRWNCAKAAISTARSCPGNPGRMRSSSATRLMTYPATPYPW